MNFHQKPITHVGHVKIKVSNLERSLKFYQEIIGFQILEKTETTAKLTTDGKSSILSLEQPKIVTPKMGRTTGLYHFAILLPTPTDLAHFTIHLVENNIRFGASDHYVSEALYLDDPDGNGIEVYHDRDASNWDWNGNHVAMTTEPLNFDRLLSTSLVPGRVWDKLPHNTVMGHIHLHVADLRKTEEFYTKGLGFDVVLRYGPQALFVSDGKYHHHIGLNTWNGVGAPTPAESSVGLDYFTLIYDNTVKLSQVVENLKAIGATVSEENGYFVTKDPSENKIILSI